MTEQELERRKKLDSLKSVNKNPYDIDHIPCSHTIKEIQEFQNKSEEELGEINASLMGRVISWRQSFLTIRDSWHDLQIYVSNKNTELSDHINNYLDIGDFVYVKGNFFKTKLGKLTLRVEDIRIVSKSINPFPSQYYGIQDDELKVRNRVARSLVDHDFYKTMVLRSKLIFSLREFLNKEGYLEIETPILEKTYGGANAVPFVTRYESLKENFFLRIATEISLKKIAIAGFPKIFEIGKVFRNEGIDTSHNPEFTSIEIYTMNQNLDETMNLVENIFKHLSNDLKIREINWNNQKIDLSKPFNRLFMPDLIKEKTGVDFYENEISLNKALDLAKKYNIQLLDFEKTIGHIFHKLFDELICKEITQPSFVYGFHKDVSPLSKIDPNNKNYVLRYELYISGMEFSNGFSELNDPDDQQERFQKQVLERQKGNKEAFEIDNDYLFALKYGLPPTGGIGIGIDRLIMLFSEKKAIKEVMFFPQVKK